MNRAWEPVSGRCDAPAAPGGPGGQRSQGAGFLAWARAGDWVNPVAVKEFRQAVQSRWVIGVLLIFLLIDLGIVGGYLAMTPEAATSSHGGRDVCGGLLTILLLTCIAFVPLYTGIRLSLERNDTNLDLLFVTTISPGAIVRGKYLTAMALTLLMFSVCMPFIALTYLLRGVDLPTIFFLLAHGFLFCAVANGLGVFAGAVSGSWFIRGVVDLGALLGLLYLAVVATALSQSVLMFGTGMVFSHMDWSEYGITLLIAGLGLGLLYVLSVCLLSPRSSNRMFVPRLYITGSWMLVGILMIALSHWERTPWPIESWVVCSGAAFAVLMVAALGERDAWSARVRQRIPRHPLLRLVAFVFYTGSAGGVLWCVLLYGITSVTARLWVGQMGLATTSFENLCGTTSFVFGYALCYCLTAAVLRVTVLRSVAPINVAATAIFVGVGVWLVPYFTAFLLSSDRFEEPSWCLLASPMVLATDDDAAKAAAPVLIAAWLCVGVWGGLAWMLGQFRRFTPYHAVRVSTEGNPTTAAGDGSDPATGAAP